MPEYRALPAVPESPHIKRTDYIKPCPRGFCGLSSVSAMLLSIIAGLFLKPVLAAVYTDPSKLPVISYTHIIVGGTSGRLWIFSAL